MDKLKNNLSGERYYDSEKADRVVHFFNNLKFTKGTFSNQPFILQPWQEDKIIRPLFGTVWEDGMRCFNTAYISTARKNGKTELGAGIALYMLCGDGEMGAEVYSAAGDKEQAALVYNAAETMVKKNRVLKKKCRIIPSQRRIIFLPTGGFYRVISADAPLKHGFNAHCFVYDELHVAKTRELWDVLSTSGGARTQPLAVALTTAGHDLKTICGEQYLLAKQIQKKELVNPTFFSFIAEAEPEDDWEDPKVWEKANPNFGISVQPRNMEKECLAAKQSPEKENTFKRFLLNCWTSSNTRWIPFDVWKASAGSIDFKELKGQQCWGGLDLSTTTDITALVLLFLRPDKSIKLLPTFWIPEDNMKLRSRKDKVPYEFWVKQGFIKTTPGNIVDYDFLLRDIKLQAEEYNISDIGYDPWNASGLVTNLEHAGIKMVPIRQGFPSLTAPTKEFEVLIRQKRMHHGSNPVLDWMSANVQLKIDAAENVKPDKEKSTERIDGIVAGILAVDRLTRNNSTEKKKTASQIHVF